MFTSTIVVGIDGGHASVAALETALKEAALREARIHAIMCWPTDSRHDISGTLRCDSYKQASAILDHVIVEATRHESGQVQIVREVSQGFAGPTLVAACRPVDLLVLGSTIRGAGIRRPGHHTLDYCLHYSSAPVLVVPCHALSADVLDFEITLRQFAAV